MTPSVYRLGTVRSRLVGQAAQRDDDRGDAVTDTKEPEPEPSEPGGRNHQLTSTMPSEALAAAYGDATRLRAHELGWNVDGALVRQPPFAS
jgi:hypothetical protein